MENLKFMALFCWYSFSRSEVANMTSEYAVSACLSELKDQ